MKNLKRYLSLVIFLFAVLIIPQKSEAVLLDAYDLLGQIDGSGDPIWTQSLVNNGTGISNDGFDDTSNSGNAIAMDKTNHRLFLADPYNARVLVFDLDLNNLPIDRYADYVLGQPDFSTVNLTTSQNTLGDVRGGLVYDEANNYLFVTDHSNNRVLVFDLSNGISNGMDASYVLGQSDFVSNLQDSGNIGPAANGFYAPCGMFLDEDKNLLFVSERFNHRILVFDLSSGITNGMDASYVLGQPDFTSNMSETSPRNLSSPHGLFYSSQDEYLYVGEQGNHRILVFDLSSGITNGMDASYVLGQSVFNTYDFGITSQNRLNAPRTAYLDEKTKQLFVGDYANERVLIYDLSGGITNGMDAANVLGQADFDSSAWGTSRQTMDGPTNTFFNGDNNTLFVFDASNTRYLIFQLPNITTVPVDGEKDIAYSQTLSVEGGNGPYTYSLESGILPTGLFLSSDGIISGTPTEYGSFTFTVVVEDSSYTAPASTGLKGGSEFTIVIPEPVSVEEPTAETQIVEEGIDKNSKAYKCYKEYKKKYTSDSYKQDYEKVKYHKRHNYFTVYWPQKLTYLKYRKISNEEMKNLKINNPEEHQKYKEYYRYRKYKKYKQCKEDVFGD